MLKKIEERFLLWLVGWAKMIDGFISMISFGFFCPTLALKMVKHLVRWRNRNFPY